MLTASLMSLERVSELDSSALYGEKFLFLDFFFDEPIDLERDKLISTYTNTFDCDQHS